VESAGNRGETARGAERARPARRGGGDHRAHARDEWCPEGQAISGRVTLGEAAGLASVSVEQLCDHLGIPRGIDRRERLGRLRRYYGFEIHDIRRLACRDD
jgi:hypothetical protein